MRGIFQMSNDELSAIQEMSYKTIGSHFKVTTKKLNFCGTSNILRKSFIDDNLTCAYCQFLTRHFQQTVKEN